MCDRHNGFGGRPSSFSSSYGKALESTRSELARQGPKAGFASVKVEGCKPRAVIDGLRDEPAPLASVKSPARCAGCGSGFQSQIGEITGPCRMCGGALVHIVNFRTEDIDDACSEMARTDS